MKNDDVQICVNTTKSKNDRNEDNVENNSFNGYTDFKVQSRQGRVATAYKNTNLCFSCKNTKYIQ